MKNNDLHLASLGKGFVDFGRKLGSYAFVFFLLFLAVIYGFILYRVNTLSTAEPTGTAVTQANQTPHIDKQVVSQLQDLKDNSVSVQTLFDEARSNPFQE